MLGSVGYNAYCDAVGWRAFSGDVLPQWDDTLDRIRNAWEAAAVAIAEEVRRSGCTGSTPGHEDS